MRTLLAPATVLLALLSPSAAAPYVPLRFPAESPPEPAPTDGSSPGEYYPWDGSSAAAPYVPRRFLESLAPYRAPPYWSPQSGYYPSGVYSPSGGSSSSSKAGLIAGLTVAVCVILAVTLVGVVYFMWRKAQAPAAAGMVKNGEQDKAPLPGDGGWDKRPSQDAPGLDKRAASQV